MESGNNISGHRKLVDSSEFQRAEDFAMREFTAEQMNKFGDANGAAAAALRIQGAHLFMQTFRLLSETPKIAAAPKILDHLSEPN